MTVVRYRLFREQQLCVSILGELIRIFSNLASPMACEARDETSREKRRTDRGPQAASAVLPAATALRLLFRFARFLSVSLSLSLSFSLLLTHSLIVLGPHPPYLSIASRRSSGQRN